MKVTCIQCGSINDVPSRKESGVKCPYCDTITPNPYFLGTPKPISSYSAKTRERIRSRLAEYKEQQNKNRKLRLYVFFIITIISNIVYLIYKNVSSSKLVLYTIIAILIGATFFGLIEAILQIFGRIRFKPTKIDR